MFTRRSSDAVVSSRGCDHWGSTSQGLQYLSLGTDRQSNRTNTYHCLMKVGANIEHRTSDLDPWIVSPLSDPLCGHGSNQPKVSGGHLFANERKDIPTKEVH